LFVGLACCGLGAVALILLSRRKSLVFLNRY